MAGGRRVTDVQAFVLGRLTMDLYPLQARTPLDEVETFQRSVGGFGGNVGTGLARLGVRTAVLSGVGDDGLGRFLVRALAAEGIDTSAIVVHPSLRTALAFCELWPPDRFPLTLYRRPTCPDQQLRPTDLPLDRIRSAPVVYVSGTALANEPSRSAARAVLDVRREPAPGAVATILDLDWRPESWDHPEEYPAQMAAALGGVDTVIGGEAEFAAAGHSPLDVLGGRIARLFLKRGPAGAAVLWPGGRADVAGIPVDVVNGLGAGDAFAATVGYGLLAGLPLARILRLANAAGAIVTTQLPCADAMPTRDELERFVEARGVAA
jgi:5-dehydro-2-deoxygluconokinase